jgi:predicted amidophosphoribosyltransferase
MVACGGSDTALALIIAFILCVECAKEPEYRCEHCDKTYKQEGRYKAHIAVCDTREAAAVSAAVSAAAVVSASDFSELLRQNREMMELMRKQQETIQLLVTQLLPVTATATAK